MSTDYSAYDDFLTAADADDRLGNQIMIVDEVSEGAWPSGDTFYEIKGRLETARMASNKFTVPATLPPPEVLKAQAATMERKKQQGIAQSIRLRKGLSEHAGVDDPRAIQAGTRIGVKTVKNKEGFLRTIAVIPLDMVKSAGDAAAAASDPIPF